MTIQLVHSRNYIGIPYLDIQPSVRPWLVKRVLPRKGVAFLVGASKAGKSFLAIDFALRMASGAKVLGNELKDLDFWPDPEERPDYYIDFDETGPYVAEVGEGECAAS